MTRPAPFAGLFVAASAAFLVMPAAAAVAAPVAGALALGQADEAMVVQVNGNQKQHGRAHRTHRTTHRSSANRDRGDGDNTAYEASGYNYGANVGSWRWPNAYGAYGYSPQSGSYGYGGWPDYGSYGFGPNGYGAYGYGSYGYGGPGSAYGAYGSAYGNYRRGCIHGTPGEVSAYPSWMVCESR